MSLRFEMRFESTVRQTSRVEPINELRQDDFHLFKVGFIPKVNTKMIMLAVSIHIYDPSAYTLAKIACAIERLIVDSPEKRHSLIECHCAEV